MTDQQIQGAILEVANQVVKEKGSVKGAIFLLLEKTRDWGVDTKDIIRNCSVLETRGLVEQVATKMVGNEQSPVIRITAKGIEQYEENRRARGRRTMSSGSDKEATSQDPIVLGIRRFMTDLNHVSRHFAKVKKLDLALERLDRWKSGLEDYLRNNISEEEARKFKNIGKKAKALAWNTPKELENYLMYLRAFCENRERQTHLTPSRQARDEIRKEKPTISMGRKVFVVHGRDRTMKAEVARFLEKLELEPIILHEQPNKGRTIIEKFEDYSDVAYAVVLLTADDMGKLASNKTDLQPRARQNVIFELGFFIGTLGRGKVCALYEEGVELPSDFKGVLYIPLDKQGGWRLKLARELKATGLELDLNKAV